MKRMITRAALLVGLLIAASPVWAQTALSSTTLSAAISDTTSQTMTVTSATGFTAPGTGATLVLALIDKEIVQVRTVSSTTIGILRGMNGTRATPHINAAPVTVGPPSAFYSNIPAGQCQRTLLTYVPYVVGGGPGLGAEVGGMYDCLGVTTAGQWVLVNGNGAPTLGSTVASPNGVLTPTGTYFKVSGTNAITGITAPAGLGVGFTLAIEPTGIFTWTAAGNITLAGTAVVAKVLYFTWNGAKWAPSYIA